LSEICSANPILENFVTNLQEPSLSGSVLIAIGLTGISKYALDLKYDDKLREKHNQSFIEQKLVESGKSISIFLGKKQETPLNCQQKILIKNK
jgi:hypothetical protein